MKRFERGVLLFLVLVLVLSSGITYLALNHATKSNASKDDQKMTVALVNEDQGAKFNDKNYEFGAEFIKNIENDDEHNWYVVSRGVAESGLERNVYNMMIVIPNDFTQKALSIDSPSPEQVVLSYKINASENGNMKAMAEKTASSILGDFNRQIIDVYFASVIGNLHDAQDNIGTLVKKEKDYTNFYQNAVHRPLDGYTAQFGAVESNTNLSRESFTGLQGILKEFETGLGEGVKAGTTHQSSYMEYTKLLAANGLTSKDFSDQLSLLDRDMNDDAVLQQLDYLSTANNAINDQFQPNDEQTATILSEAAALQAYLTNTKEKIDQLNIKLTETLASDMQQSIGEKLKQEMKNKSGEEQNVYLNQIFAKPDESARNTIQKQIDQLPSLNPSDLDGLGLNEPTLTQLKNILAVTNKYNNEFDYIPNNHSTSIPLSERVNQLKTALQSEGVTLTDTVSLPRNKKTGQEFTLSIPKAFEVTQVLLTLPNSDEMDYTEPFLQNQKLVLPATDKGQFKVNLKVRLKEADTKIDVFQPVTWNWELDQKDVTNVDTPDQPETAGPVINATEPVNGITETITSITDPAQSSEQGTSIIDPAIPADPSSTTEQDDNQNPNPIIKLTIFNNHITHQVMSPLMSNVSNVLINAASDTVSDYQKLQMLYGSYFGITMDQFNRADFVNDLRQTNLSDLSGEDSLYYLFNKQDIVDVLANYIAEQITEEVRQQTEDVKSKVDEYIQLVTNANQNSVQLTERIKGTTEQAELLNTHLAETLKDLAAWREESLHLQTEQTKILMNGEDEQKVVLSLGNEFNTLLAASQSLADQSKNNLASAETVYHTFDAIDQQAKEIQASGTTLVKQAGNLSNELTNKLAEDQSFADNFAQVLANSRIGERPNEELLSFLSNPVETKNAGVMAAGDTFTPYFVVLICFIVALFTAYVISTNERRRLQKDSFAEERTIFGHNTPITIITASIGLIEGLVIGIVSAYLLQMGEGKFLQWTGYITLVMFTILLVATYLLRQLKMFGMFILLVILSLYLFLTEALGLRIDKLSVAAKLRAYSPLQYIEKLLLEFGSRASDSKLIMIGLIAIVVVSLVGHLFVSHRVAKSKEVRDEGISEAL
ncbi:type VII secretion protein EsaA [Neobacillus jeddahensis]|uniref:type VII secretion protein EsaA n=1 Tax=Neobacillus jeddahensis TaxID=1461580 RepID=UPI00069501F4|nr:type VII secretion protein EsaA [Neobacillus jeddahensis]